MNIYKEASRITGIPKDIVEKAYGSYWRAVREHLSSLPLKEELTEGEFNTLQPSISLPSLGKLYVTHERQKAMRENYSKHIKNKDNQKCCI